MLTAILMHKIDSNTINLTLFLTYPTLSYPTPPTLILHPLYSTLPYSTSSVDPTAIRGKAGYTPPAKGRYDIRDHDDHEEDSGSDVGLSTLPEGTVADPPSAGRDYGPIGLLGEMK